MNMGEILWPLEPQTVGKHKVLRAYLNAWLPILGSWAGRILFIDGFAGPGEYAGGEPGSPVIALDALIEHNLKHAIKAEVIFFFIERDEERARHLNTLVQGRIAKLPAKCKVHVLPGDFTKLMNEALNALEKDNKGLAPAFLMIDPFGVSDVPLEIVRRVLQHDSAEVYVSFMYEAINRFKSTPEFEDHLDALFGTPDWRNGLTIPDADERKNFYYDLYENQLRGSGAEHVVRFELYQENRLVYAIFFATKHSKGCDRMKQAIWRVAPQGDFQFRGTRSRQLDLAIPTFEPLKALLVNEFKSKGWTTIEVINEFVASDRTEYHTSQYKTNVLVPMEETGEIDVDPTSRKRRKTFPEGTRLRFK